MGMLMGNKQGMRNGGAGPTYDLGLTASLISVPAQNNATWIERTADISLFIGATARLVVKYTSGTSYTGDIQLDDFNIGGNIFDPEVGVYSFQRNSVLNPPADYLSVTWAALTTATSGNGLFLRDSGGTGSTGTGNTTGNTGSFYYYAETSNGTVVTFWLRSEVVTITTGILSLFTAQNGATCGPIEIYLDIIS